jgi:hypothetical protein
MREAEKVSVKIGQVDPLHTVRPVPGNSVAQRRNFAIAPGISSAVTISSAL